MRLDVVLRMKHLICPHCGNKAISLIKKLALGPKTAVACASCGEGIGVSASVVVPVLASFALVTASGYVESNIAKSFFWSLAVITFVLLSLFRVPLEPKELETHAFRFPAWLKLWLGIIAVVFIAWEINFFPSDELRWIAWPISFAASYPIVRVVWKQDTAPDQKVLAYSAGYGVLACVHYIFFAVAVPAAPTAFLGQERVVETSVHHKSKSHKAWRCKKSLELDGFGAFPKNKVCVSEETWQALKRGDTVSVVATHSWFGDFVQQVSVSRPQSSI